MLTSRSVDVDESYRKGDYSSDDNQRERDSPCDIASVNWKFRNIRLDFYPSLKYLNKILINQRHFRIVN